MRKLLTIFSFLYLSTFSFFGIESGKKAATSEIVGGTTAEPGQFPYQTSNATPGEFPWQVSLN